MIWRVVTHEGMRASYTEVTTMWTLDDLDAAHAILDAVDEAHQRARAKAEAARGSKAGV